MLTQHRTQLLSLVFVSLTFFSLACADNGQGIREMAVEKLGEAADKLGDKSATTNTPRVTPTSIPHKAIPGLPANKDSGRPYPKAEITAIELTQGIQNLANTMPLIQDRSTYARVYVKAVNTTGDNDLPGVMGELCGFRDEEQIGECLLPENDGPIVAKADGGDRLHLDDSFYFYLPPDWRKGNVTFRASTWNAADLLSQDGKQTTLTFHQSDPLNLLLIPVHLHRRNPSYWVLDDKKNEFATLAKGGEGWGKDTWATSIAFGRSDYISPLRYDVGVTRYSNKNGRALFFDSSHSYDQLSSIGNGWGKDYWAVDIGFGDVDNDGLDEIVIIRHVKAEGEPRLAVYDDNASMQGNIQPIFQGFAGWASGSHPTAVALGNVDSDDELEIAVVRKAKDDNQPRLVVLDPPHPGDPDDDWEELAVGLHWGPDRNPTDVAFGDVDGDGQDEIGVSRKSKGGEVGDPRYVVLKYNEQTKQLDSMKQGFHEWGNGAWATSIAFGDVDGDGLDEIGITRHAEIHDRWFIVDDAENGFETLVTGGDYGPGTKSGLAKRHATAIAFGNIDSDAEDEFGVVRKAMQNETRVAIYDPVLKDGMLEDYTKVFNGFKWGEDYDPTNIAFGDVDGDGLEEVGVSREYTGEGSEKVFYGTHPDVQKTTRNMYRYHPISDLNVSFSPAPIYPWTHFGGAGGEWELPDNNALALNKLKARDLFESSGDPPAHLVGMVHPEFTYGGVAYVDSQVSLSTMNTVVRNDLFPHETRGSTLAHEIGHDKGSEHANCKGTEAAGGAVDPEFPFPFPDCQLSEVDPSGYYGFDVYYNYFPEVTEPLVISNDPTVAPPHKGFPLMGYKYPRWISPYTYCGLLKTYGVGCGWFLDLPKFAP